MPKLNKDQIEDNLIGAIVKETDDIFFKLYDSYPEKDDKDIRLQTFLHSMMTSCMLHLYSLDYSVKDIIDEAFNMYQVYENIVEDTDDE